jgi:hypothetical protein
VVELAANDVEREVGAGYEEWNAALARRFFDEDRAGELVYLDKDDEAFAGVCSDLGVDADDADDSLANAIRAKLYWKDSGRAAFAEFDRVTSLWLARRRDALANSMQVPPPPHIALLTLFSLAAERIGGANTNTGAVESSYYSNLERLLAVPATESGRFRTSFTKSSEAYWESLSLWLEDQDGHRGLPSAYALMHRYVGLPISQALVRARERRNLKKMFEEQGFVAGMTVSLTDMYGAIDVWINSARTSANTALVKMWASSELKSRIVEIALAEFATWEGVALSAEGKRTPGQNSGRCLLTVRDGRVLLRSELRFGLMVGGTTAVGETCRVEGLNGAAREFTLEALGIGSTGFDFRAVGIDAGSAITGDLRITMGAGKELRRFPKNVVILTRDAFSAGYIESDRINAAALSRILIRDEPQLVSSVERILDDAAQPGYARILGGTGGVPQGWTVFTDVVLLRAPAPALVSATDLSAFQPRLSTQMTITGGLKLPGHVPRWSALSSIQVMIASESEEPVDLVLLTRNAETLQTEEHVIHRGLAVPAVIDLDNLPDSSTDFTLSLRRGKTILQNLAVKLKSSLEPSPDLAQRFRSLCHDLEDPVWPMTCVASEDAVVPGLDGLALSAPPVPHQIRSVASRANWAGNGRMRPSGQLLVVAGPPENSCIATGRHRFDFPTFDGKRPKSTWMYGVCTQCGMSKRQPTWVRKSASFSEIPARRIRHPLPELSSSGPSWSALIDSLFFLGAGSRREFSTLARQIEDTALFENQLLRDLEALSVIELERNDELDVVRWESAATCFGQLADGSWILTGFWNRQLKGEVLEDLKAAGATISVNAPSRQSLHVVDDIPQATIAAIAEKFEVDLVANAAVALANALPKLSAVGAGLARRSMPFAESYEYFNSQSVSWVAMETAGLPGLYRVSHSFSSRYYFRSAQDVADGLAALVTVELGKHLAALAANRPLIAYDPVEATLSVPVGAELPGIYGRAAVMGDGGLPEIQRLLRSTTYFNIPTAAAEALIGKLTS